MQDKPTDAAKQCAKAANDEGWLWIPFGQRREIRLRQFADLVDGETNLPAKEAALRATAKTMCVCGKKGICYVCQARAALKGAL